MSITMPSEKQVWTCFLGRPLDGRYPKLRHLPDGGMSTLTVATTQGGKPVLLKQERPNSGNIVRFMRECCALRMVHDPHVSTCWDWGVVEDVPTIVVEWADGVPLCDLVVPLSKLVAAGNSDAVEMISLIGRGICNGLLAMHGERILHRDIKPGNVIVSPKGEIKIIDLGLAIFMGSQKHVKPSIYFEDLAARVTNDGEIPGTPFYVAPEGVEGGGATYGSDVYGVAALLYELVTGFPPFYREDVSRLQLFAAKTRARCIPDPRLVQSAVPCALSQAIHWASLKSLWLRSSVRKLRRHLAVRNPVRAKTLLGQLVADIEAGKPGTFAAEVYRTMPDCATLHA